MLLEIACKGKANFRHYKIKALKNEEFDEKL
jgi:hypothetical protein